MARIIRRTAADEAYADQDRLAATTDADIERQMLEDGEELGLIHHDWHPSAAQIRKRLNLTQAEMAKLLGMPLATWRNWEQGRTAIDAPGRALLILLEKEPEAVLRAMRTRNAA